MKLLGLVLSPCSLELWVNKQALRLYDKVEVVWHKMVMLTSLYS